MDCTDVLVLVVYWLQHCTNPQFKGLNFLRFGLVLNFIKKLYQKWLSYLALSGRLNVLANVTRNPLEEIFCQFDSKLEPSEEVQAAHCDYIHT
jgi:hypothetical protein